VLEMLAYIHMALKWPPCKLGMYLPGMTLARIKSDKRFMPIVRTVSVAYNMLTSGATGTHKEGSVLTRQMGDSLFYFMRTSGQAMTESVPLDVLTLDEVQEDG